MLNIECLSANYTDLKYTFRSWHDKSVILFAISLKNDEEAFGVRGRLGSLKST